MIYNVIYYSSAIGCGTTESLLSTLGFLYTYCGGKGGGGGCAQISILDGPLT